MSFLVSTFVNQHVILSTNPKYTQIVAMLSPSQLALLEGLADQQTIELRITYKDPASRMVFATVTRSDAYFYWQIRDVSKLTALISKIDDHPEATIILSINRYGMITNIFSDQLFLGLDPISVYFAP